MRSANLLAAIVAIAVATPALAAPASAEYRALSVRSPTEPPPPPPRLGPTKDEDIPDMEPLKPQPLDKNQKPPAREEGKRPAEDQREGGEKKSKRTEPPPPPPRLGPTKDEDIPDMEPLKPQPLDKNQKPPAREEGKRPAEDQREGGEKKSKRTEPPPPPPRLGPTKDEDIPDMEPLKPQPLDKNQKPPAREEGKRPAEDQREGGEKKSKRSMVRKRTEPPPPPPRLGPTKDEDIPDMEPLKPQPLDKNQKPPAREEGKRPAEDQTQKEGDGKKRG